jgi:hypothetical protein
VPVYAEFVHSRRKQSVLLGPKIDLTRNLGLLEKLEDFTQLFSRETGVTGRAIPAHPNPELTALELVHGALQAWRQPCGAEPRQAVPAEDPAGQSEAPGRH